jgi:hypothetical protein
LFCINKFRGFRPCGRGQKYTFYLLPPASCPLPLFGKLAGKIGVIIDLVTHLPIEIWFWTNPKQSDTKWEEDLLKIVKAKTLLLLDRGFYHFAFWQELIPHSAGYLGQKIILVTR